MSKENNGHLEQLCQRAQKITEALYRVTDLFTDQEPLKWLLRREGIEILDNILKIKSLAPQDALKSMDVVCGEVQKTGRILELAASGSFISETNFQVLQREYRALCDFMSNRRTDLLPDMPLIEEKRDPLSIGQPIGQEDNPIRGKIPLESADLQNANQTSNGDKGHNGRREKIMALIKERDWVSVGELAQQFNGEISEKTIQRDLIGMASEGLLLKEGDKRWRKYKLAASNQQPAVSN